MVFTPSVAPCPLPLTNDAARWFRCRTGGTTREDPCRNGSSCGTGATRAKLGVTWLAGASILGDITASIGAAKGYGLTTCTTGGYFSCTGNRVNVDVWGAFDAAAWSSSIVFTVRATTATVLTDLQIRVCISLNGTDDNITLTSPATTVLAKAVACATDLTGCNQWIITLYDDGSFTVA